LVIDDLVSFGDEPDLFDKVLSYLTGILPTLPEKKALEIEQELRALHGGDTHYIRKHISYNALSAFNGRNASEIARIMGVSRSTVYRKLKQPKKNTPKS
jgi:transcriptional regulator of acetoin/glycerol metabolism